MLETIRFQEHVRRIIRKLGHGKISGENAFIKTFQDIQVKMIDNVYGRFLASPPTMAKFPSTPSTGTNV